jgi:WD40 repeat protein
MKDNPYVGPRPYERGEQQKFYGRDREARDLLSLLMAERAVLFYAKSGAGKTSLLNAEVIPALEEEGFRVLPVARVSSDPPPGVQDCDVDNVFALSVLMSLAQEQMPAEELCQHTLASFLEAQYAFAEEELGDTPFLLIFDQFEELFTTHRDRWQDARGFFVQVRDALRTLPGLGVLFAMREDHVAELDPFVPLIPRRLRARFRMELLGAEGALEAITRPAQNAGIRYDAGVAERLVDDLRRIKVPVQADAPGEAPAEASVIGPFVEPVQLQVVCRRLWEQLPEQEDRAIQWEEVTQYGDVDRALIAFYEGTLEAVEAETGVGQKRLRRWFDEQLITPMQTRGLALRGPEATAGLPNAAVDALRRRYLLRSEVRASARWYELAHDRLIDPILQSNAAWEAARQTPLRVAARNWERTRDASLLYHDAALREAQARVAQMRAEELEPYEVAFLEASEAAQRTRTRIRRLRLLATVMGVLTLLGLGWLAWWAGRNELEARSREYAADASYDLASHNPVASLHAARAGVLLGDPREQDPVTKFLRPLQGRVDTTQARMALRQALVDFYPSQRVGDLARDPYGLAYSPDGTRLYAALDGRVQVWDAATDDLRPLEAIHTASSNWGLDLSQDGRRLAVAGQDRDTRAGVVGLLDVERGEWLSWLHVPTPEDVYDEVYAVAFSPDGHYLAAGGDLGPGWSDYTGGMSGGLVRIWALTERGGEVRGTAVLSLTAPLGRVNSVAFRPMPSRTTGRTLTEEEQTYTLAAGSNDGTVYVWSLPPLILGPEDATPALTLTAHTGAVKAVAFSPQEHDLLATASRDKTVRVWDLETGEALMTLVGHTAGVQALAFSDDGRYLFTGARDLTVRIWDVEARNPHALAVLSGPGNLILALAVSPDANWIVAGTGNRSLYVWDRGQVIAQRVSTLSGHRERVRGVAYSPDGEHLASADHLGHVRIWNAALGRTVRSFSMEDAGTIWNIAYSHDGRYLVTCTEDDRAHVWDTETGDLVTSLEGHGGDVEDAAFSPDDRYLLTGADDHRGLLWDTTEWRSVAELTVPGNPYPGYIWSVAYGPQGRWAATGYASSLGAKVILWALEAPTAGALTATPVVTLTDHGHHVMGLDFSPDGRYLASAAWDGTVRIWSTETLTGVLEAPLTHAEGVFVYDVAFSPAADAGDDALYLATGARDGHVRLWRLEDFPRRSPELVADLEGHTDLVWSVAFSPDGRRLASGSWDGTVRRYPVRFEDVWALSEAYLARMSTPDPESP